MQRAAQLWSSRKSWWLLLFAVLVGAWLRWYQLGELPRGLNWDETAYAYNAYSLAQTGYDEWGYRWPVFLKSFGEYKPAIVSYLILPGVALFPANPAAARAMVALLGTLSIVASYGLVWQLSKDRWLALFTAFTLAVSPWHIHFSRTILDPSIAHPLLMLGIWAWSTKRSGWWLTGGALLGLAMYAYNAERLFVPLLLMLYAVVYWRPHWHRELQARFLPLSIWVVLAGLIWGVMVFGQAGVRARTVSFFGSSDVSNDVVTAQVLAAGLERPWLRLLHNPLVVTTGLVARQYGYYWRPDFLFFKEGGVNASPILGFPERGNLLEVLAPFLAIGLVVAASSRNKTHHFFLWWALLAPIPGALTTDGPHAGRALIMLPALNYLIAVGIWWTADQLKKWVPPKISLSVIWLLIGIWAMGWLVDYVSYYPEQSESSWQGQFRDMSQWVGEHQEGYDQVYITRQVDPHALLFFAWYSSANPTQVQAGQREGGSPYYISQFGKTKLIPSYDLAAVCPLLESKTLTVLTPDEAQNLSTPPLKTFHYFNRFQLSEPVFQVYDSDKLYDTDREFIKLSCQVGPSFGVAPDL